MTMSWKKDPKYRGEGAEISRENARLHPEARRREAAAKAIAAKARADVEAGLVAEADNEDDLDLLRLYREHRDEEEGL